MRSVIVLEHIKSRSTVVERLVAFIIAWALGVVAFAATFGVVPRIRLGWIVFLIVAPLLYFAAEFLSEILRAFFGRVPVVRAFNCKLEAATATKRFSWLRVFCGLFAALVIITVVMTVMFATDSLFGRQLAPIKGFMAVHFGTA